jgi:hypothetical protein
MHAHAIKPEAINQFNPPGPIGLMQWIEDADLKESPSQYRKEQRCTHLVYAPAQTLVLFLLFL